MASGGERFVDGNVDGGEFGAGEARKVLEVEGGVDDGDVHGNADLRGFLGRCFGGEEGGGVGEMGGTAD